MIAAGGPGAALQASAEAWGAAVVLLPAALAVPWLAAAAMVVPGWRERAAALAPWCAAPALLVALALPLGSEARLAWVLLDVRLRLDATGAVFLRFSAAIWLLAGAYARGYMRDDPAAWRFFAFWLVALGGNAGVLLAADVVSFYFFFATLGLACYGLIFHRRDASALRAANIYLVFVLLGDGLLFAALVMIARAAGDLAIPIAAAPEALPLALLVAGLGIKLGIVPLHVWLPIAHPAAPIPASAVLSGVVIKSGLFGWLRFLPLGEIALPGWSTAGILAGLVAVFYAAALGTGQRDPKTVLAYSSVSQMGLITTAVGLGLAAPAAWAAARVAILAYATHHAITKSVLFLGVDAVRGTRSGGGRAAALGVLCAAAGALAGLPFTGGAAAKALLKAAEAAAAEADALHMLWLPAVLSVGAAATAVLMGRFVWLMARTPLAKAGTGRPWPAWGALAAVMLALPLWPIPADAGTEPFAGADVWSALWPVTAGGSLAVVLWWAAWRRGAGERPLVPPGDILVLLGRPGGRAARAVLEAARRARSSLLDAVAAFRAGHALPRGRALRREWERADRFVRRWPGFGTLLVLVLAALVALWRLSGT